MKRTFLFLLATAAGIWTYVAAQIIVSFFGSSAATEVFPIAKTTWETQLLTAKNKTIPIFRDPFSSFLYAEKPAPPKAKATNRPKTAPEEPMLVQISGLMLGDPPMAILKSGTQTEIVKAGGEAFGYSVQKISPGKVTLKKSGTTYTLAYP